MTACLDRSRMVVENQISFFYQFFFVLFVQQIILFYKIHCNKFFSLAWPSDGNKLFLSCYPTIRLFCFLNL